MNRIVTKPHWESQHDGWVSDFVFWVQQKWFFVKLLRKHPGDVEYIKTVRGLEKIIEKQQNEYKKLYGTRFNLFGIKKEIEQ